MIEMNTHEPPVLLNDPNLPHLAAALDLESMPTHFTNYLHGIGLDAAWEVTACKIEKAYYRVHSRCGLLYRLHFHHETGKEAEEWFFAQLLRTEKCGKRFKRAESQLSKGRSRDGFLRDVPAVSLWRDFDLILWVFPYDPQLGMLSQATDPDQLRKLVDHRLPVLVPDMKQFNGELADWRCEEIRFDRIKYMPRKRCVLRYHATLQGPNGESRKFTFFSKTHKEKTGRYYHDLLDGTLQQLQAQQAELSIPKPLVFIEDLNTAWQEDWGGEALIKVLDQRKYDELFPKIANMAATFHNSTIEGLPNGPTLDEVLATAIEDGQRFGQILPQNRDLATAVLDQLNLTKDEMDQMRTPAVPIHGAFRMEQMLARGPELALIDFDALAVGDPLYDISEFVASLLFLEFSQERPREKLVQAADLFLERYHPQVAWACDQRRIAWYVLSFVMSKLYSSIKNLYITALNRFESSGAEFMLQWLNVLAGRDEMFSKRSKTRDRFGVQSNGRKFQS